MQTQKEPIPWVDPIPAKIRIQETPTPTPLLVVAVPEPDPAKTGFVTPLFMAFAPLNCHYNPVWSITLIKKTLLQRFSISPKWPL